MYGLPQYRPIVLRTESLIPAKDSGYRNGLMKATFLSPGKISCGSTIYFH